MHERSVLGADGEAAGARWLESRGWRIVDRNVRYREGELDIIAARGGILAFIEVKTRRSVRFGIPREAVTSSKQRKIRAVAARYLMDRRPGFDSVRFDVPEVDHNDLGFRFEHLEGCF
ncbi:MAG: YraN family protein [Actinomycetota bacterium]